MSDAAKAVGLPNLARIRSNWERAQVDVLEAPQDRFAKVATPLDPFAVASPLLARLEREVDAQFPEQRAVLAPFILRVRELFGRLSAQEAGSGAEAGAVVTNALPASELRASFVTALNDLEDLCEALLHIKR